MCNEPQKEKTLDYWNNPEYWKLKYDDLCNDLCELFSHIEKTCYMEPTWIDGCLVGTCSICGSVEWDYDPEDLWSYCHGCGGHILYENRRTDQ